MKLKFFWFLVAGLISVIWAVKYMNPFLQTQLVDAPKALRFFTYQMSDEAKQYGPRLLTLWNLTHVAYYAIGAYYFPQHVVVLWFLGVLWEIIEHVFFRVGNALDIVYNSIGILIGLKLRGVI